MRTRATRAPSAAIASSTDAPASAPFASSVAFATGRPSTSRKSPRSGIGAGRAVRYATGKGHAIVIVVIRPSALAEIVFRCGVASAFGFGAGPNGPASAAAALTPNTPTGNPAAHKPQQAITSAPTNRTHA